MTFPSVVSDLLMLAPSCRQKPLKSSAELQWQVAVVAKISQLILLLTVDPNVHTGAFCTGFLLSF